MFNIITGDICKVRTVCYTPSQISVNVMHLMCTAHAGLGATDADLALAVDALLVINYKPLMSSLARWRGAGAKIILPTPRIEEYSIVNDGVGTGTAQMCPTQVSGLIGLYTARADRKGRGRIYPGFIDDVFRNPDGSITAGGVTALNNIASQFAAPVALGAGGNTSVLRWGIFSKTLPGGPSVTYPLTSAVPRNRFATQRKRGQYGRTNVLPF